jgi:hypothetical protein
MSIFPKPTSRINVIPTKIIAGFVVEIGKLILKFMWNRK